MLRYIVVLSVFTAFCAANVGPDFPATKGEVWPKPQHQVKKNTILHFDHANFQIKVIGRNCPLLKSVVSRYSHILLRQSRLVVRTHGHVRGHSLAELHVNLTGPCEEYPHYGMDERYNVNIENVSTLQSASVWGIMRGLQTFLHSFYISDDYKEILINATEISDFPRYSHRGLLLDTSRHYISLQNILLMLDGMEMNKMNVFHWHIVDDESFPYQSKVLPELSEHAAYYPTMVYSKADIVLVLKYARERGIRVVPEFDIPGHTLSWGASHPEIMTKCIDGYKNLRGALNPVINGTYELLESLIKEVQDLFPDKSYHVGGDEVDFDCWQQDPTVQAYLKEHNKTVTDLLPIFMNKVFAILGERSQATVWEEIFKDMHVPPEVPVQIWMGYGDNGKAKLNKVLDAGNKAILSAPWYLDHLQLNFNQYYDNTDPEAMVNNKTLASNVLGGEACMWSEAVDDRNVISSDYNDIRHKDKLSIRKRIIWPRASAPAEVLWSSPPFNAADRYNKRRLEEHTCRMLRHDIGAEPPNGRPGVCVVKP